MQSNFNLSCRYIMIVLLLNLIYKLVFSVFEFQISYLIKKNLLVYLIETYQLNLYFVWGR